MNENTKLSDLTLRFTSLRIILFLSTFFFLVAGESQEQELLVQLGHTDRVRCVAVSGDNKYAVSGGMDQVLKLWDLKNGLLIRTFKGHKGLVYDVVFSNDNLHFYTCSWDDRTMKKWNINQENVLLEKSYPEGFSTLTLSCNATFLYAANSDEVCLIDVNTLQIKEKTAVENLHSISFDCTKNQLLLSSDSYSKLKIGNSANGDLKTIHWEQTTASYQLIAFSDKQYFLSDLKQIWTYNPNTKQANLIVPVIPSRIASMVADREGRTLFLACDDGSVWRWRQDSLQQFKNQHSSAVNELCLYNDEKQLITVSNDQRIKIWDTENLHLVRDNYTKSNLINDAKLYDQNKRIVLALGNSKDGAQIGSWDLETGRSRVLQLKLEPNEIIQQLVITKDQSNVVGIGSSGQTYWFKFPSGSTAYSQYTEGEKATCIALTKTGKSVVYGTDNGKIIAWRPDRNKKEEFQLTDKRIMQIKYSADFRYLLAGTDKGSVLLFDDLNKKIIWEKETHGASSAYHDDSYLVSYGSVYSVGFNTEGSMYISGISVTDFALIDSTQLVVCGGNRLTLLDFKTGDEIWSIKEDNAGFGCVAINRKGDLIAASGADGIIHLYRVKDGSKVMEFFGHQNEIRSLAFLNDEKISSAGLDAQLKIWDLKQKQVELSLMLANGGKDQLIFDKNGYYSGSKGASDLVTFRIGNKILPFSQFDLLYNRPDKIIAQLNSKNVDLINSYQKAYDKRLKKMNFSPDVLQSSLHLPEVALTNASNLPVSTDLEQLTIALKVLDSNSKLDRLHVLINQIPLYGVNGISLKARMLNAFDTTVHVHLSSGPNKIQISVLNQAGAESYKETILVNCTRPATKPNLYFVGIGVKNYEDSSMNLKFSDKDIRDVATMYAGNKRYGKVFIDTFINENATTAILPLIQKRLATSTIHDQVIFMYSGHGILDSNLNYYLTTHNINFSNPKINGIPYDDFDALLDGIPARQKLVLIDACHSGEVDKDETAIDPNLGTGITSTELGKGDLFKQLKSTGNSFELMQELFNDLRRGTGATIISSSAGKYYSYEDQQYRNGIYTYALKLGLAGAADRDKNDEITISELKTYLYEKVAELSNGKQKPTARQENLEMDWRVW